MIPWLGALLFTQVVEVPVYLHGLRGGERSTAARLGIAAGASLLTHPVVWFASPLLPLGYEGRVLVAEGFAVLAEAAWLAGFGLRRPVSRALGYALVANVASAGLGLASRSAFGWP